MQQTTINQAQSAFEQAFELQRNATKMALSMLEMQDTAGRQGLEVTKTFMQNYLQGVEAIMPEIEETMETGMRSAMQGGPAMHGGSTDTGRRGGQQQGGQMGGGQQMGGEGQMRRQQMTGGQQQGQRMAGGQHGGHSRGEMYGGESHGYDRSGQHGGQPQHQLGQPQQGGYGRTGEWIPHGQGGDRDHPGQQERAPGGERQPEESPRRQMTTPTGGEERDTASDRDQMTDTPTDRGNDSEQDDRETTDHQSSDKPEEDE